ncbi:M48 family metalloprotease [Jannaschia ovalis]|uniref:M48 family metalloprotease n=1 Tax=Jannaschia ovalis TaxID=3038773 RepID=A0ABY8LA23_9RHOB|nr:M48 family metalloprotease [Jannaschia sp. GRR-S6-38]WGH78203.1 M48 family metalloprotease [Jannaschia sp. GRR-S6-38]
MIRLLSATLVLAWTLAMAALPARAQGLIRDAEIEYALRQVAAPIFRAAGLPASTRIYLIDDDQMNAFVGDARSIFIHSGLLMRLETVDQVQAVLAHEAAHIVNGHLTRRPAAARSAANVAKMGLLLGAAAAAAAGPRAGFGLAVGTASSAQRSLFAHTRAEESSADQSSLRFMAAAGADPNAALEVLEIFRGQELLSVGRQDPYARTHPLTRDRLRAVEGFAAAYPAQPRPPGAVDYWHARARGKLSAFLRAPRWTLSRVRGAQDEVAVLRRAIAHHRQADAARALAGIDSLIRARGSDPYYHELKGQFLLESGRAGAAVASYARAAELAPREGLIQAGLGRALMATGRFSEALPVLERARSRDPFDPRMLRDLATAHARLGQPGLASVAAAERYAVLGRMEDAGIHAERASAQLPRGSAGWLRAQDILAVAPRR